MTEVSGAYAQRLLMTLFLVSFGIYLFLASMTYTPFDPGWMHISNCYLASLECQWRCRGVDC